MLENLNLMEYLTGWGLTETNFTSEGLKEVEVILFLFHVPF